MTTRPKKLTEAELSEALQKLEGWQIIEGKLHREYKFKDFITAFAWMSASALVAEKINHHPEWSNVWSTVTVDLTTHDVDGLTALDLKLARKMESLASRFGG